MSSDPPVTTTGTLVEPASGNAFITTLPNGKRVYAFPSRSLAAAGQPLEPGQRVALELTPYDFSKARITSVVS